MKRTFSAILAAVMLISTLVFPAAAATPGFVDVPDPREAQAAETLRLLNIVGGTGGGYFNPTGTLTRAEFCKMAVEVLGKGAEAKAQMNRTIFQDVLGTHWARGYVNLAASLSVGEKDSGDKLMMGMGDGNFYPDVPITYAQAVTLLLRVLGYGSQDLTTGGSWYAGALATGSAIGLTEGLSLTANDPIPRGKTAILFEQMIFTAKKAGKEPYLVTDLGGKILKEAVILSLNAVTDDGVTDSILTTGSEVPFKTNHVPFPASLAGVRAKVVLDKDENVVAILPVAAGSRRSVSIISAEILYFTAAGGERISVAPATPVYKDGKASTYEKEYGKLKPSTLAVLSYSAAGKLEYIFLPDAEVSETAAVAKETGGNPFPTLVGNETGYRVIKNGLSASIADVRPYDVGTYDKATKTLYVSDLRLTGVYENAAPSPVTPLTVSVMGMSFPVLPSASGTVAGFKIGDVITLLFTADGRVAGVVAPADARSTAVGIVREASETHATVDSLDILDENNKPRAFDGNVHLSLMGAAQLVGQLVTISSSKIGELNLSRLSGSGASGALDLNARTLGTAPLAENVRLYERVGTGAPSQISFAQLTRATVPASKIAYVGKDYAGRVNLVILDDATGDGYHYGMAETGTITTGSFGTEDVTNGAVWVVVGNSDKKVGPYITGIDVKKGQLIGIAPSLDQISSTPKLAGWVSLQSATKVPRSAFDLNDSPAGGKVPIGTVTAGNLLLPVAGDVICYNQITKKWFDSLESALAYSNSLTVYYDKAPQEGGKVRIVVVE